MKKLPKYLQNVYDTLVQLGKTTPRESEAYLGYHFTKIKAHMRELEALGVVEVCDSKLHDETGTLDDVYRIARSQVTASSKFEQYRSIWQNWQGCERCALASGRTNVVFGRGNLNAPVVYIGMSPDAGEDASGIAGTGEKGRSLLARFKSYGFDVGPKGNVFLMNICCCRSQEFMGDNLIDVVPTKGSVQACLPHLEALLDIVYPSVVIVDAVASELFFKKGVDNFPFDYKGVNFLRARSLEEYDIDSPTYVTSIAKADKEWMRIQRVYSRQVEFGGAPTIKWKLPLQLPR
jgi:uracil-DNA glycosylase family 4